MPEIREVRGGGCPVNRLPRKRSFFGQAGLQATAQPLLSVFYPELNKDIRIVLKRLQNLTSTCTHLSII